MALRPGEAPDSDELAAEDEVSERTFNDRTAARPVFTPAAREAADDVTPGDVPAHAPAVVEPAGRYPDADDVGAPAGAPAAAGADDPAEDYVDAETDEAAPGYGVPAAHEARAAAPATPRPAAPAAVSPAPAPVAGPDLDQPLLSGDAELLARWQRVQAGFIDDPQAAVADAADLVEQAGQALVDALQRRQRQVRTLWDHGPANGSADPAGARPDTEQLRQVMRRYRALFSQLYPAA
jgi:hypothetical protein